MHLAKVWTIQVFKLMYHCVHGVKSADIGDKIGLSDSFTINVIKKQPLNDRRSFKA